MSKRGQVWSVKMSPAGEFISAVYECILCDVVILTHDPGCAMMQVCPQCAQREPTRPDIDRIFASGFEQRRDVLPELSSSPGEPPRGTEPEE